LLFHKLTDCGLSAGYVNWLHSYLTIRLSHVRYYQLCRHLLKYYAVSTSILGPFLLDVFINDLRNVIKFSSFLGDGIRIFRGLKSPRHSVLQIDIVSIRDWYTASLMKLNVSKTEVISFTRKTVF
jgi:hypothetical protein